MEQLPLHWREHLWRMWIYKDYGKNYPFGEVQNNLSTLIVFLCCKFLPKWFWKLVGKRVPEIGKMFKTEETYNKFCKNFKYSLNQCTHCGIPITDNTKIFSVPSGRSEWGDRILCERCWGWRTAIHESVKQGQLKIRQENET